MTTQQVKIYDEISQVIDVAPNLWQVDKCFSNSTLRWLQSIDENEGNEFIAGALKRRLQLKFGSHDFARLNQIGIEQKESLEIIVGNNLELAEVKYWIDLRQFGCQMHSDAPELFVNYQVYLDSCNHNLSRYHPDKKPDDLLLAKGAEFHHVTPPFLIDFVPNRGYINLNADLKNHCVASRWDVRTSVMFQYARA
jgi:hypothetical protein